MDQLNWITSRRSIRKYQDKQISDELVKELLGAAMSAPSAGNQQPWHFIVVRDREKLENIGSFHPYAKMAGNAPPGNRGVWGSGGEKMAGFLDSGLQCRYPDPASCCPDCWNRYRLDWHISS